MSVNVLRNLYGLRIVKAYVISTAFTVLLYDVLCTLDREVKYIWSSQWNTGTVLFMLNRYLPIIDTGIALYLIMTVTTPEMCRALNLIITVVLNFGVLLSELILILRTYAIWNRNRPVLVLLRVLALITSIAFLLVVIYAFFVLQYGPMPQGLHDPPLGCRISRGIHGVTSKYYMEVLFSETIILLLTMIRYSQHRNSRSRWVSQLYRDGLLFYLYMLVVTGSNITVYLRARSLDHKEHVVNLQRVIQSICCNRVILGIQSSQDSTQSLQFTGTREGGRTMTQFFTTISPEFYETEIDHTLHETTTSPHDARMIVGHPHRVSLQRN